MKKFLRILFIYIPLGLILLSVLWVVALKWLPVVRTPLMDIRVREFRADDDYKCRKQWVRLEDVSDNLVMAVMASEDNRFLDHKGFDRVEIRKSLTGEVDGYSYGKDTLTQVQPVVYNGSTLVTA